MDDSVANSSSVYKENELEFSTKLVGNFSDDELKNTSTTPSTGTTLPSDIINNVHSNNYFENISSDFQKKNETKPVTTKAPQEEQSTDISNDQEINGIEVDSEMNKTTNMPHNNTHLNEILEQTTITPTIIDNEVSPEKKITEKSTESSTDMETVTNKPSMAMERMDITTEDITVTTTTESYANPAHNFNEISSSTEDLIALETTTKQKVIQAKSVVLNEQPTTVQGDIVDTVKTVVHFITSEEENDVSGETDGDKNQLTSSSTSTELSTNQSYEVNEPSNDITTTEKIFISVKPRIEAETVNDELSVEPLTKAENLLDEKKDLAYRSIDSSESNNILDENTFKISTENSASKQTENSILASVEDGFNNVKPVTEDFELPKFVRCLVGQFQCSNGTSIKDGSYCIPYTDRCDSVFDCSDGSDETNCEEEHCPNNFQVGKRYFQVKC